MPAIGLVGAARPGRAVLVRRIEPADAPALEQFYAGLSGESRRLRFLAVGTGLGREAVRAFCGPDHEHREGFVALVPANGGRARIVGHLCLEPTAPEEMEIAVAVADEFQGHGIGGRLLDVAAGWAGAHGTRRFRAWFAVDNAGIRRLLAHLRRPISPERWAGGLAEVTVELDEPPPEAPAGPPSAEPRRSAGTIASAA